MSKENKKWSLWYYETDKFEGHDFKFFFKLALL